MQSIYFGLILGGVDVFPKFLIDLVAFHKLLGFHPGLAYEGSDTDTPLPENRPDAPVQIEQVLIIVLWDVRTHERCQLRDVLNVVAARTLGADHAVGQRLKVTIADVVGVRGQGVADNAFHRIRRIVAGNKGHDLDVIAAKCAFAHAQVLQGALNLCSAHQLERHTPCPVLE